MPWGLKRYHGAQCAHFITFSCYRRQQELGTPGKRDVFEADLERVRRWYGWDIYGYVVMPEHVHLLMGETPNSTPSVVLHRLKLRVAKRLRRRKRRFAAGQMELPFEMGCEEPRSFWQARFHDFNVYRSEKIKEKLNYMHANPVKRGLVNHPKDWEWSSWGFYYGEKALLVMDNAE